MSEKRKRNDLSLSQKLEILKQAGSSSQTALAQQYGCSQSAISKIIKQKASLLEEAEKSAVGDRKRKRGGKAVDIEKGLFSWFTEARARDCPITTAILEDKATKLAHAMGHSSFKPTNGWLCRWKTRYGVAYKRAHGEKQDADGAAADTWSQTVVPQILEAYAPADVYNADETGIYFRALPDGTLALATEKLSGGKKAKERITALVTANMDGSDKRPLFIIGKSKQPRCFKNATLPLPYSNNRNAWMTGEIFTSWLRDFDRDMKKAGRNIALILDNCSAHPKEAASELKNIRIFFLPPNTTSICQPCDMGIIRNLKAMYRKRVVARVVAYIDSGDRDFTISELAKRFTLLDAMLMLREAWEEVKQISIQNCFKKAGFAIGGGDDYAAEVIEIPAGISDDDFNNFVSVDDGAECHGSLSLEEIASNVAEEQGGAASDDESTPPAPLPTSREAMAAIGTLQRYFNNNTAGDVDALRRVYAVEKDVQAAISRRGKQTSIKDFC